MNLQQERQSRPLRIVFSGVDGAGKSTQITQLLDELRKVNQPAAYLWVRGGYTPVLTKAKAVVRKLSGSTVLPQSGLSQRRTSALRNPAVRRLWLLLALAEMLWVYAIRTRFCPGRKRVVIYDRFIHDSLIDFNINFPQEHVEEWWLTRLLCRCSPKPDVSFLMLVPVDISIQRSFKKQEPYPDTAEVLTERIHYYQCLKQTNKFHSLDGCRPVDEIAAEVWSTVNRLFVQDIDRKCA